MIGAGSRTDAPGADRTSHPSDADRSAESPDVSVVMPCLNEANTLGACIDSARRMLQEVEQRYRLSGEIVVCDNGSTDGSVAIGERLADRVVHCASAGYGIALQTGIAAARGRFVVMRDTDGSHDFADSVAMVEKLLEGHEFCMGTRFKGRIEPGAMTWKNRYIGNPVLTGILNLFYRARVSDAHCGLRAFTRAAYERIRPTSTGMEFASEMIIKAVLLGVKRAEVPITMHVDGRGRPPHLRPWRDGWRHLRYLLMLNPTWLYFGPAAVLGVLGSVLFAILLSHPSGGVVRIGGFALGDHWMPLGEVMLALSHQAFVLGIAATLYGVREGYRIPGDRLREVARMGRLEYMLLLGAVLVVCGLLLLGYVIYVWQVYEFGALARIREMIAAATLIQIGMQNILGGFILSVISGNKAQPREGL